MTENLSISAPPDQQHSYVAHQADAPALHGPTPRPPPASLAALRRGEQRRPATCVRVAQRPGAAACRGAAHCGPGSEASGSGWGAGHPDQARPRAAPRAHRRDGPGPAALILVTLPVGCAAAVRPGPCNLRWRRGGGADSPSDRRGLKSGRSAGDERPEPRGAVRVVGGASPETGGLTAGDAVRSRLRTGVGAERRRPPAMD